MIPGLSSFFIWRLYGNFDIAIKLLFLALPLRFYGQFAHGSFSLAGYSCMDAESLGVFPTLPSKIASYC